VIQLIPGHGWLDIVGLLAVFAVAVVGFFVALAVVVSLVDPDADGSPERWPSRSGG
jgi:hypothetical protein